MKTLNTKIPVLYLMFLVLFSGCTKKGDTGPQGPAGKNGNANVISTIAVTPTTWTHVSSNDSYITSIAMPEITQAIVDYGAVMVYIKSSSGWLSLPYAAALVNTDFIKFEITLGNINIIYRDNSSSSTIDPTSQSWSFRIVAIPEGLRKPNVDVRNYNEVKEAYNL